MAKTLAIFKKCEARPAVVHLLACSRMSRFLCTVGRRMAGQVHAPRWSARAALAVLYQPYLRAKAQKGSKSNVCRWTRSLIIDVPCASKTPRCQAMFLRLPVYKGIAAMSGGCQKFRCCEKPKNAFVQRERHLFQSWLYGSKIVKTGQYNEQNRSLSAVWAHL